MSMLPYYVLGFILALGILIVVHEFGHYWVAKRLGVKVLRFSVGFGRPLWQRRVGPDQMELVVAALPFGGYVKMLDETEGAVNPAELPRAFNRQPVWKRMAIVVAGPLFNFIFAIIASAAVYMVGIEGIKPIVGKVLPNSIAADAGFREGDELVSMDGKTVQSWGQRRLYLFQQALDQESVQVDVRDTSGQVVTRTLDLSRFPRGDIDPAAMERRIGLFAQLPEILPVVGALEPGPAANAGMQVGDRILRVDGKSTATWEEVVEIISANPGRALAVTVERAGVHHQLTVTPAAVMQDGRSIGRIQIRPQIGELPADLRVRVRLGPLAATGEAFAYTWSMSVLTLEMLYRMLILEVSSKNISGPITIAQYAGYSAKIGVVQFVLFLAVISISLGVLNLLPIPVLDGGHLLYYAIEAVKGSPVSERIMAFGHQVGIVLLVGLMVLAFYNDLTRIFQ